MSAVLETAQFDTSKPTIMRHPHSPEDDGQRWTIFIPDSFLITSKDPNLEIALWLLGLVLEGRHR